MYYLHIPAKPEHVRPVCVIAQKHFGNDRPKDDVDLAFHLKNPYQLATITDKANNVVGFSDMFILKENIYHALIEEKIKEAELLPEDFPPWPEAKNTCYIYSAATAVNDRMHQHRPIWANALRQARLQMIRYYLNESKFIECSMVAYSPGGVRVAELLGYKVIKQHRHGPFYAGRMNLEEVNRVSQSLPAIDPLIEVIQNDPG